jgi:predicted ATPase
MARKQQKERPKPGEFDVLTSISLEGFKSFFEAAKDVQIRRLTVLAGANSSGKSSLMQPLLLMKQTLDAPYDPGVLRLLGPYVQVTSRDQVLARGGTHKPRESFKVSLRLNSGSGVSVEFRKAERAGFEIAAMSCTENSKGHGILLRPDMDEKAIREAARDSKWIDDEFLGRYTRVGVVQARCFLRLSEKGESLSDSPIWPEFDRYYPTVFTALTLRDLIHLPGLRGNPEREYRVASVDRVSDGPFQNYTASVILNWQEEGESEKLRVLGDSMKRLGLTWKVQAERIDDARIRLNVGRLTRPTKGGADDLVNIADVGIGISQVLPVVVALMTAKPGQVVYIEQPEIHLHPRAQVALAGLLVEAANRGVRVIAETHSDHLLLAVQTQVAEGVISAAEVALHWFSRDKHGATSVRTADLDEAGRYGDWPEDFSDTEMDAQNRYLDAAEKRLLEAADAAEG